MFSIKNHYTLLVAKCNPTRIKELLKPIWKTIDFVVSWTIATIPYGTGILLQIMGEMSDEIGKALIGVGNACTGSKWRLNPLPPPSDTDPAQEKVTPPYNQVDYKQPCPYTVLFTQDVWEMMRSLVHQCPTELGGHLEVLQKDDILVVKKVYIPHQKVTSSTYRPNYRDLLQIVPRECIPHIRGWFHSHAHLGVSWSFDDVNTIKNSVGVSGKPYVSIVMNKNGNYLIRIDEVTKDETTNQTETKTYNNIKLHLLIRENPNVDSFCKDEIINKVSQEHIFGFLPKWLS